MRASQPSQSNPQHAINCFIVCYNPLTIPKTLL